MPYHSPTPGLVQRHLRFPLKSGLTWLWEVWVGSQGVRMALWHRLLFLWRRVASHVAACSLCFYSLSSFVLKLCPRNFSETKGQSLALEVLSSWLFGTSPNSWVATASESQGRILQPAISKPCTWYLTLQSQLQHLSHGRTSLYEA